MGHNQRRGVEHSLTPRVLGRTFHPYAFRRIRWRAFRREYSFAWLNEWQCRKLESLWRRGLLSEKGPNVDKKAAWRRAGAEICTRLVQPGAGKRAEQLSSGSWEN